MNKFFKKFALTGNSNGTFGKDEEEKKNKDNDIDNKKDESKDSQTSGPQTSGPQTSGPQKIEKIPTPIENKNTNGSPRPNSGNNPNMQPKKKASGGKVFLYVLLIVFIGLLIWSLFFSTLPHMFQFVQHL